MTLSTNSQKADAAQSARVLIVGDDVAMVTHLSAVLRSAGHTVVAVASPDLALQTCTSQSFRLAIVDESVCAMAGPELARALRDFFTVPTLFLSEYNDPEIVSAALADGSLGLIVKPLETASLLPALQIALTRACDIQAHAPRNGLRRYVYAYWQQLLSMGHRLLDSTNDRREIDAAIMRSRRARNASQIQGDQETEFDSIANHACASRRNNVKH